MNNDAIGVFDSGIGGITAVKELNRLLPNENIIYFGDTARIPYGSRSRETILKFANQDIAFLKKHKIKMLIAACGTVSSVIGSMNEIDGLPFTGVLLPAAQAACGKTRNGRIGVIGTAATIKSGSYGRAIRAIRPDLFVVGNPCPLLVPLAENGYTDKDNKITRMVLEEYLEPMKREKVDTLILGCTHYPILSEAIAEVLGSGVTLISASAEAAKRASAILTEKELLSDRTEGGSNVYYVSDSTELFSENVKVYLGHEVKDEVHSVDLDLLVNP